jgi:hypothetical protein
MEVRKENSGERRKRKTINRPVLVRSVKPGQAVSATYSKTSSPSSFGAIWRS